MVSGDFPSFSSTNLLNVYGSTLRTHEMLLDHQGEADSQMNGKTSLCIDFIQDARAEA